MGLLDTYVKYSLINGVYKLQYSRTSYNHFRSIQRRNFPAVFSIQHMLLQSSCYLTHVFAWNLTILAKAYWQLPDRRRFNISSRLRNSYVFYYIDKCPTVVFTLFLRMNSFFFFTRFYANHCFRKSLG